MSRPDRPGVPHVRIPDRFYKYLRFFRPPEFLLLVALSCKASRRGPQVGLVGKETMTLKEISRDLEMPWSVARRAFNGLQLKGFAWRKGRRLYVQCDLLGTALATDFGTLLGSSSRAASGPQLRLRGPLAAPDDRRAGPLAAPEDVASGPESSLWRPRETNKGNGINGFTHGRSVDPSIRARVRKRARHGAIAKDPRSTLYGRSLAGSLPPSLEGLTIDNNGNGGAEVSDEKKPELEARWLTRDEMHEIMGKIRSHVEAAESERDADKIAEKQKESDRRAELRRQADELLAEEGDEAK